MVYTCKIKTYDAGRNVTDAQKSAERALQLRAWGAVDLIAAEAQAVTMLSL